jgi:hypothetical protein
MKRLPVITAAGLLIATQAAAGELVTTAGATGQTPPQAAAATPPLGAQPMRLPPLDENAAALAAPRCAMVPPDGKVHGEVWGGVGTRGYREAGGAATMPTGKCSSVSIAVDHVQGDFGGWRR